MGIYTWGQLRLNLQQTAPGLSLDLIDEYLNVRYARVLEHSRWSWLDDSGQAYIETAAAYQSSADTVSVTQGSNAIIGTGTSWTSGLTGQKFQVTEDGPLYTFTYVSATTATLDRVYEGTTNAVAGYSLFTVAYALPSDLKAVLQVSSADDGFDLTKLSDMQLGESVGFMDEIGEPAVYDVIPSPVALDGGSTWQIVLFPIPQYTKGYPVLYQRAPAGFTGSNTGNAPLPFVSDGVMLAGCRADIWAHLGDENRAKMYEAKFGDELDTMLKADSLKKPKEAIQMARRFTRHRMQRVLRNTFPRIPN